MSGVILRSAFCLLALLLASASVLQAAGLPVAQVYLVSGGATIQAEGATASVPLKRGAVLSNDDKLALEPGAEIGIYYRNGGRRVVSAKERAVSGNVAAFAPELAPYRGQAVFFGATRGGPPVDEAGGFLCSPHEVPVLGAMPVLTLGIGEAEGAGPFLAAASIRVLRGDSIIASAMIETPTPHRTLRLEVPEASSGEEYTVQVVLTPADKTGEIFTHAARFYIATPAEPATEELREDFLTPFFQCRGRLDVRLGSIGSIGAIGSIRLERRLESRDGTAVLSTFVAPVLMN